MSSGLLKARHSDQQHRLHKESLRIPQARWRDAAEFFVVAIGAVCLRIQWGWVPFSVSLVHRKMKGGSFFRHQVGPILLLKTDLDLCVGLKAFLKAA